MLLDDCTAPEPSDDTASGFDSDPPERSATLKGACTGAATDEVDSSVPGATAGRPPFGRASARRGAAGSGAAVALSDGVLADAVEVSGSAVARDAAATGATLANTSTAATVGVHQRLMVVFRLLGVAKKQEPQAAARGFGVEGGT